MNPVDNYNMNFLVPRREAMELFSKKRVFLSSLPGIGIVMPFINAYEIKKYKDILKSNPSWADSLVKHQQNEFDYNYLQKWNFNYLSISLAFSAMLAGICWAFLIKDESKPVYGYFSIGLLVGACLAQIVAAKYLKAVEKLRNEANIIVELVV